MPERQTIIEQLQAYFANHGEIDVAYLFGSYARNEATTLSDVDVGILWSRPQSLTQKLQIEGQIIFDLQTLLHIEEINVVELDETPATLNYRVIHEGILLLNRDENKRIRFTLRTINEYLDFQPVLERHEKAVLAKARQGRLLDGYNRYRRSFESHRRRPASLTSLARTDTG